MVSCVSNYQTKVGRVFPMVVRPEFHTGQYRQDGHREEAHHFSTSKMIQKIVASTRLTRAPTSEHQYENRVINFLANGEKLDIQEQIKKLQQARFPRTAKI